MKRLIFLALLMFAGTTLSYAQGEGSSTLPYKGEVKVISEEREPVTSKWSMLFADADYTSHYLNSQEYSGSMVGIEAIHGRFFRKSNRLSWRLTLSHLRNMQRKMWGGGLENAAGTSHISTQSYEADYAVYYNWLFNDRLQVRAGGSFNLYGGFLFGDGNAINNILSGDLQTQLYARAQVRYGWDFERFGLDIYANLAMPFMGMMAVDNRYESFFESLPKSDFNLKEHSHLVFSTLHNFQGVNYEIGVDFAFDRWTLSLSNESRNRWWNAYELQNYRKASIFKIGVSLDMLTHQYKKTGSRHF